MLTGKMTNDVELLGTDLKLAKGEKVYVIPATNQPFPDNFWFVRPIDGWSDGIERSEDDSILVNKDDVAVDSQL